MNKKAAIYTRVSSTKNSQATSLVSQEEHYIDYCERMGYELSGLYAEKGITGTNARKRPEFLRLMHDSGLDFIRSEHNDQFILSNRVKKFDYIIVKDPSRFSRSASIGLQVIELLRKKEVYVVFENSGYTSEEEAWHFNLSMLFTIAQTESHNMSRRIKFSKKHMANKGEYKPARVPFGYVRNEENQIVIEPEQAEIVKYVFERFLEVGSSIIARELNEKGVKSQTGVRMSPDKVLRIVNNSVYRGSPVINRSSKLNVTDVKREKNETSEYITIPNAVEAIVSEELWNEANKLRESRINKTSKRGRKTAKNDLYFEKLYCANCESRMVKHTGQKEKITYMCQSRRKGGICVSRGIAITVLNRFMRQLDIRYMTNAMGNSFYYQSLMEHLENQKGKLEESRQSILDQIEEYKAEKKNYAIQYASTKKGAMKETLSELVEEKQKQIAELERKLADTNIVAIEQIQKNVIKKKEMIETVFQSKNFTPEEKLSLLKKAEVGDMNITFHFSLPTFEEEVSEFNKLFSINPISSDLAHNPFASETIRRDHKAAREQWERIDEETKDNEESYGL